MTRSTTNLTKVYFAKLRICELIPSIKYITHKVELRNECCMGTGKLNGAMIMNMFDDTPWTVFLISF